jgi:amidohydrolase
MSPRPHAWLPAARKALPAMRAWRVALHREPELSGREEKTRAKILAALRELEIPTRTFDAFPAVVGLLGGDRPGPVVALRADMDGLPVEERTGFPFRSNTPGAMHACGHDVHMASVLGAAMLLKRSSGSLLGPVKLLFQPAEEDGVIGGAGPLIARGALERPKVDFVVGQHVDPAVPLGQVGWGVGPFMAAADYVRIVVRGRGGHASTPQQGPDAILIASEVVVGLQALASRVRHPADPVVVSIGSIHGGTRHNILPDEVVLEGTVRTFRPATRDLIESALKRRVHAIARSLGARASVEYKRGYPALHNPPEVTRRVARALEVELGRANVLEMEMPLMGAEDFTRYLEKVPGTFLRLGVGESARSASLHSATFAPDERAMVFGAATLAAATVALQGPAT